MRRDRVARPGPAILHAIRLGHPVVLGVAVGGDRLEVGEGREEALALALEELGVVVQLERGRHEVLRARPLFEAADEVGDGHVELLGVHDRHVEQQVPHLAPHGLGLTRRHAEQHLELDALRRSAPLREQPREGDVEEVVAGDADPHVAHPLGMQRVVEHGLVAGVGGLLGGPRPRRPAVHSRVDELHRQVRALDDAHLDGGAAAGDPLRRPLLEPDHGAQRIGEVRLQHDPGLQPGELRAVEEAHEDRQREVEVLVLLHVEVDELLRRRVGGAREEGEELLLDVRDRLVERPVVVRGDGRGDLDGDVVDVVAGEEAVGALQAPLGIGPPEDRLAQQVHVEPHAVAGDLRDRRPQPGVAGVDDEVADELPQHAPRDRYDDPRHGPRQRPAEADRPAHRHGEERRRLRHEFVQPLRGNREILGAHDPVDEAHGEVEPVRVAEHAGEARRRGIGREGRGLGEPAPHERDGVVCEVLRADFVGGAHAGLSERRGGAHRCGPSCVQSDPGGA